MVVELVAGRLVAKHLGSSIFTWTSVIGVILAGLALGNEIGGRFADRRAPHRVLAALFLLASGVSLAIPAVNRLVAEWVALWTLRWPVRVSLHVAAVFFLPSMVLGMISPVAAKMALDRGRLPGRTLGSVNAWGVVGSLLGTFMTGYWFIPSFGTARVVWSVAAVLGAASLLLASGWVLRGSWIGLLAIGGVLQLGPWAWARKAGAHLRLREEPAPQLVVEVESAYSDIRVLASGEGSQERRHLLLDKMMHNTMALHAPDEFEDRYLRLFRVLSHVARPSPVPLRTLTIGGGGYLFPRYIERHWPGSRIEVVEIDPEVTRIARDAFGLPASTTIASRHEDGRTFVNRLVEREALGEAVERYDLIYLDAFNDYSVPYQLTTVELAHAIHRVLDPSGVYLINAIDSYQDGLLLGAMVATLEEAFPFVHVFYEGTIESLRSNARETFVLYASPVRFDFTGTVAPSPEVPGVHELGEAEMAPLRARTRGLILTDDHAPTENLLVPVVSRSAPGLASGALVSRGVAALNREDLRDAEQLFRRAVAIDASNPRAHRYLGYLESQRGNVDLARAEYARALRLDPQLREAVIELVVMLEKHGLVDEAAEALAHAVAANPTDLELRNNLGILHARRGDATAAIRTFSELARAAPDYFEARRNLGLALLQAGDASAALGELEAAARLRPDDASVQRALERARSLTTEGRAEVN
jgi:Flp pilus assembly protein TadD/spermidine synthase